MHEEISSARWNWVDLEIEAGDDAEVPAATAAQRPQQVRIGRLVDLTDLAVGGDDLGGVEVVAGEPERTGREPLASAERHPGDPHRRARPTRDRDRKSVG